MTAIIGPSGSGKTTLMNYLAGRNYSSNLAKTGSLYVNGVEIDDVGPLKNVIGFVTQEDTLNEEATPKEIFTTYGKLKGQPNPEKKVQEIIDSLDLQKCANTYVGGAIIRGISGGEKKRVSIGVEIIGDPALVFMDEPTTGLDSNTAFEIMKLMSNYSIEKEMTVISVLHQPSKEIMDLFDKVIILCDGMIVYDDAPGLLKDRLERIGFDIPKFSNPIEYFLEAVDKDGIRIEVETMVERENISAHQMLEKFYEINGRPIISEKTPEPQNEKKLKQKIIPKSDLETLVELIHQQRIGYLVGKQKELYNKNQAQIRSNRELVQRELLNSIRNDEGETNQQNGNAENKNGHGVEVEPINRVETKPNNGLQEDNYHTHATQNGHGNSKRVIFYKI